MNMTLYPKPSEHEDWLHKLTKEELIDLLELLYADWSAANDPINTLMKKLTDSERFHLEYDLEKEIELVTEMIDYAEEEE